jgi:hypothetical protein
MDAQSYLLKQEHRKWIVCAEGKELMACADKRTALKMIKMAAKALKDSRVPKQPTPERPGDPPQPPTEPNPVATKDPPQQPDVFL